MKRLKNLCLKALLPLLSLALGSAAHADEAACHTFVDYMKVSYSNETFTRVDLLEANQFRKENPEDELINIEDQDYSLNTLAGIFKNSMVCGKHRTGLLGILRTKKFSNYVSGQRIIPPELIVAEPPLSPEEKTLRSILRSTYQPYRDASERVAKNTADEAKNLEDMMDARESFWKNAINKLAKEQNCANVFCAAIGSVDTNGIVNGQCAKSFPRTFAREDLDQFHLKLSVSRSALSVVKCGAVSDKSEQKPNSARIPASEGVRTPSGTKSGEAQ